ncbi:hypothetical protein Tco_1508351 [Tanacetum coccineum]
MDMAYGRRWKRRIGNCEYAFSCEDLALIRRISFPGYGVLAGHVDAYDSDCDDEATANAIFMANLSPVASINDDTVEPQLGYIDIIVSDNTSYDEPTGNNNVISYADYMVCIGNNDDNYVPPRVQKNDMILSVIKNMKSRVN